MKNPTAVYVQTNDGAENEIIAYERAADGRLSSLGRYATGGRGTGTPHLPSQNSIVLTDDGRHLLVANAGSDDVSVFEVGAGGLQLSDRAASGGVKPASVAVHRDLVYVLNAGTPNISGFVLADGKLKPLADPTRKLSADDADPAQIAFGPDGSVLVVTERGTNGISTYAVDDRGYAEGPSTIASVGATPYGFDFTADGVLIVTEAFGGEIGKAAASSYARNGSGFIPVSRSIADTRSEVCWVAVTKDGRVVYVTNFGDGTISSYAIGADGSIELLDPLAASTRLGEPGVRDEALTRDGRFLYAIDADAERIFGWTVGAGGKLTAVGEFEGVPATVAGLAAS